MSVGWRSGKPHCAEGRKSAGELEKIEVMQTLLVLRT